MTAELYLRPRRGKCLEADMASMSVEDLKCVLRDVSAELDHALTTFLPAGARLADANEIEIPDDEPMYVAGDAYATSVPAPVASSGGARSAPFANTFTAHHWAHEA